MLDQSLIRSGFDTEILLGERQLSYIILALIDAGAIPTTFEVGDPPKPVKLRGPITIDRTYEPLADAALPDPVQDSMNPCAVEILFGHSTGADLRVHAVADISALTAPLPLDRVEVDFFVALGFVTERDADGMLAKATLQLTLLDFASGVLEVAEDFGVSKEEILAILKEHFDRSVDLGGVSTFKRVQDIAFQKLDADEDHPRALGLYVNLRLQTGPEPESLKEARGDLAAAKNFLPEGSDAAMVSRAGLYGDLAADTFNRFAEIDENGNVSRPWRKSPFNPKSKKIGKIVDVDVGPILNSNTLKIDVEGEYEVDNFFDPNVHLVLNMTPSTTGQGTLTWKANADFHASLALEIIGFVALAALFALTGGLAGFTLGGAIAFGIIGGSLADLIGREIVDAIYSGRVEKKADAALPDVVTGRVEVAQRRWDPFYTTHHQVALRPDGALVNEHGVALWGRAVIDRETRPAAHVVVRDKKVQGLSPPTHLRYRILDEADFREDFSAVAPGTDRRSFEQHDPVAEPMLFQLGIGEIEERLAEGRIIPDLAYIAKRIDMRDHQVHSILAISQREINETRNGLIGDFAGERFAEMEAAEGAQIRMEVEAEFAAEGVTPTEEQIVERIAEIIAERIAPAVDAYIEGPLDTELEQALLPLLRFDLPPEHFAALQKKKILHLLELEIITMRDGFMYYRDRPDFHLPDNLHSLPRYKRTPTGPQFP